MSLAVAGTEANPFLDPLRYDRPAPDCTIVIFGANGDLTRRKLVPALYTLAQDRRLPPGFAVYGISRTPHTDEAFRAQMRDAVAEFHESGPPEPGDWEAFAPALHYEPGHFDDPGFYARLASRLRSAGNILYYLSTQPSHYALVAEQLGAAGLANSPDGWRRLIVEKPFGRDLASARGLNAALQAIFSEEAIYRIDHYLGKETVQNILALRFGNGLFEPLWNRGHVQQVQITAAESIGVEGRGQYYEESGALRDMIQNHLLQVLATIAMEPPSRFEAGAVRDERAKVLRALRPLCRDQVAGNAVKGQYGPARVGGRDLPGYRQEPGVPADSQTETYAAVTFFLDNWRWAGVPFYLRTGKRLPKRVTEIAIQFAPAPLPLFDHSGLEPNLLVLRIQPEEGISLKFQSKSPGAGMRLRGVSMDFHYGSSFGGRLPSAYETLLLDALEGDATLYTRQDMVEASWQAVEPILEVWGNARFEFPNYASGSWGPAAAEEMLARRGHHWRQP
jgi:glucose-6-phosphate 1-dehydrogenase